MRVPIMACKINLGQSDSTHGNFSATKITPEIVEDVSVKLEIMDDDGAIGNCEDNNVDDASRISPLEVEVGAGSGVESSVANLWPRSFCQPDTGSCSSFGETISGSSHSLGEPSIHSLKEERLFNFEKPTEAEEQDPLADLSLGVPSDLSNSDGNHALVIDITKTTSSTRENFLEELRALGIRRFKLDRLNIPRATKPVGSPSRVKTVNSTEPGDLKQEVPVQEPGVTSVSDTTVSDSFSGECLERISMERFRKLTSSMTFNPKPSTSSTRKKVGGIKAKACQTKLNASDIEFLTKVFDPAAQSPSTFHDNRQLGPRAKSIVFHVANYFQEKKKKYKLNYDVLTLTSSVTNLRLSTVQNILTVGRRSLQDNKTLSFPSFKIHRTEKCKNCGDVLVDFALREIIFNGYVEERKALTVAEISAYLDKEELYVCHDFLRRRIGELGFDLMRCISTSGYVPLERPELTASRYRYLQDIERHRSLHHQIVYVFEVDLSKVVHGKVIWEPMEGHPTKADSCSMTVIHAARESGFIEGSLFVHSDTSRQHRKIVHPRTVFWLNLFLPKLSAGTVVVLGHNRHHFVRPAEPKPDASWPKQDILEWLHNHQKESFSASLPSAVLLEKVNTIDVGTTFGIDDLVKSYGHIPLHLPQNHRELNPVELVWRKVLEEFPSIDIGSEGRMKAFLQNKFDSIPCNELQEAFELAKNHEKRLKHLDLSIENPVGEVIRRVGGILDRKYALAESESDGDEDLPPILEVRTLGKSVLETLEASKKKSWRDETTVLVLQGKKRKTAQRTQGAFNPLSVTPKSPLSRKDLLKISTHGDRYRVRYLEGDLKSSHDVLIHPKEDETSLIEGVDCIAGTKRKAQSVPQNSYFSLNASEGIFSLRRDGHVASKTLGEKHEEPPEELSSSPLFVAEPTDAVQKPTDIIAIASDNDAGPSRSPRDTESTCVANVSDITFTNPTKEEYCADMIWEPGCPNLTLWSED